MISFTNTAAVVSASLLGSKNKERDEKDKILLIENCG
jgi:hypothetical protein